MPPAAPAGQHSDAEMSPTSPAHRASLQERHALSRRRGARHLISPAVALEDFEILLKLLPGDVAWMSVRETSEPIMAFAPSQYLLPVSGSPVAAAAIHIGTGITWIVQHAYRRRCGQRPENRRIPVAQAGWKAKALLRNILTVWHADSTRANVSKK